MNYREIAPSAATSRFVKCYWTLEDDSPSTDVQRIVPDGRPELILNFAQPFESQISGQWKPQPECFFVGQITGPFLLRPRGPARMLGVRFHPHGASELFGLPIWELTDSVLPLEDISRRLFRRFRRLRELRSLPQQLAALDRILHLTASSGGTNDPRVSFAVGEFERAHGAMGVKHVADRVGLSSRQLERRFKNAVGISPKLFSRMQRFQRVFRAMDDPDSDWVTAAVHCGYYDQAHLIRDFREFSGKTPTALLAQELDLIRHFVQSRPVSHFSKTLANASL